MSLRYPIARNVDESERLIRQHDLWIRTFGYRIHPVIAKELGSRSDVKVADIGCGTGIWLHDLAHHTENTSWHFDGFDISGEQFPHHSPESAAATAASLKASKGTVTEGEDLTVLPPSVELHVHDTTQPFPKEHHGQYDLVHLRLMVGSLAPHEWVGTVHNLKPLLKPNGWIQWEDFDGTPNMEPLRSGAGPSSTVYLQKITNYLFECAKYRIENVHTLLREAFGKSAIKDVQGDVASSDRIPELRTEASLLQMQVTVNVAKQYLKDGLTGAWSVPEIEEVYKKAEEEVKQGAYVNYYLHCYIGRP